jgi:hypothetical protein
MTANYKDYHPDMNETSWHEDINETMKSTTETSPVIINEIYLF